MKCKQKFCKFCCNPRINLRTGAFVYGICRMSKYVVLDCIENNNKYKTQLLYCNCYRPRKRKINY